MQQNGGVKPAAKGHHNLAEVRSCLLSVSVMMVRFYSSKPGTLPGKCRDDKPYCSYSSTAARPDR